MVRHFILILSVSLVLFARCTDQATSENTDKKDFLNNTTMPTTELTNEQMRNYPFLSEMYEDEYFPKFLVDKCQTILINLCKQIEAKQPKNLNELYILTHAATEKINDLEDEFDEHDSEIETIAREAIAVDFEAIANAYGYTDADIEELIATRNW